MNRYAWTTQMQVRAAFWRAHPHLERRYVNGTRRPVLAPQNMQPAGTRVAFVDYVDALERMGAISESLAGKVTL